MWLGIKNKQQRVFENCPKSEYNIIKMSGICVW